MIEYKYIAWHNIYKTFFLSTGLTNIITVDLHSKEIQGFYDAPVDNLRASPFLVQYITDKVHVPVFTTTTTTMATNWL